MASQCTGCPSSTSTCDNTSSWILEYLSFGFLDLQNSIETDQSEIKNQTLRQEKASFTPLGQAPKSCNWPSPSSFLSSRRRSWSPQPSVRRAQAELLQWLDRWCNDFWFSNTGGFWIHFLELSLGCLGVCSKTFWFKTLDDCSAAAAWLNMEMAPTLCSHQVAQESEDDEFGECEEDHEAGCLHGGWFAFLCRGIENGRNKNAPRSPRSRFAGGFGGAEDVGRSKLRRLDRLLFHSLDGYELHRSHWHSERFLRAPLVVDREQKLGVEWIRMD